MITYMTPFDGHKVLKLERPKAADPLDAWFQLTRKEVKDDARSIQAANVAPGEARPDKHASPTPQPAPPAQEQRELVPGDMVMAKWAGNHFVPRYFKFYMVGGIVVALTPEAETYVWFAEWRLPTADELKNAAAQVPESADDQPRFNYQDAMRIAKEHGLRTDFESPAPGSWITHDGSATPPIEDGVRFEYRMARHKDGSEVYMGGTEASGFYWRQITSYRLLPNAAEYDRIVKEAGK